MLVRPILHAPDERLRVVSSPVEAVYAAPGRGLAAIQIGVPKRILVIDAQIPDATGKKINDPRTFINPELFDPSPEKSSYREGCLSIPDYRVDVERPAEISCRWLDEHGASHEERMRGFLATALQHEMDHLEGILITDHASSSADAAALDAARSAVSAALPVAAASAATA